VLAYAMPGRVDHHSLIMLVFTLSLAFTARMLRAPVTLRASVMAGATAGFGVWLSPEFLLLLAVSFAALAWAWVREGAVRARTGLWFSLGLSGMIGLALVVEYRPAEALLPDFQRISSVHLVMALIAAGFWAFAGRLEGRRSAPLSMRRRLRLGAAGGAVALGAFAWLFPGFFAGPTAGMDERARIVLLDMVMETGGLLPEDGQGFGRLFRHLGIVAVAAPVAALQLFRERQQAMTCVWVFLNMALAVYAVAALFMLRFSPFAGIVGVIVIADASVRAVQWAASRARDRRWPKAALGIAAVAATGLLLAAIWANAAYTGASVASLPPCHQRLKDLSAHLNSIARDADDHFVIVAMADMGPELLYRTGHRVIATPSLSNQAGAVAMFAVLSAHNDRTTRHIIEERGIDHVLLCRALPSISPGARDRRLIARLRRGAVPPWLAEVPLPEHIAGIYALFRVNRDQVNRD